MKIRRLAELAEQKRVAQGVGFFSHRYILQDDNMGFSLCRTEIQEGGPYTWHYKYHKEACLCISGIGLIQEEYGPEYMVKPGDIYILDSNEKHHFTAVSDVVLISIFNPPLTGLEVHGPDHSYPENDMIIQKAKMAFAISNDHTREDAISKLKQLFL